MLEVSVLRPRNFSAPSPGRSPGWGQEGRTLTWGSQGSDRPWAGCRDPVGKQEQTGASGGERLESES